MPRLSLCMIVRNEERFLAGALESARGAVDEMLVVDTGSQDRTRAIATEHGARVLEFAWCDDFSAARNHGLEAARGTHILVPDADERPERALVAGADHRHRQRPDDQLEEHRHAEDQRREVASEGLCHVCGSLASARAAA